MVVVVGTRTLVVPLIVGILPTHRDFVFTREVSFPSEWRLWGKHWTKTPLSLSVKTKPHYGDYLYELSSEKFSTMSRHDQASPGRKMICDSE